MKRFLRIVAIAVAGVALLAGAAYVGRFQLASYQLGLPSYTYELGSERDLRVAMRDGVELNTTVYEPEGDGPWPTVLIRNPYDMPLPRGWCGIFARFGYACVYQEVRGQMESGGDWEPMVREPDDGEDTLAWLIQQPFQNGNIGFYGPSYLASVQWATASHGLPPEVKTMVPMVFATDLYSLAYERGMFRHEILTAWAAVMPGRGFNRENTKKYQEFIRHRPMIEIDERYFGVKLDWFREYLTNPSRSDALWQRQELLDVRATPPKMKIPVLLIGGWYDIFFNGQLSDWDRLGSREQSKLVIGPWTHLQEADGDLDFDDARGQSWQWELVLDWMGHHLRGEPLDQKTGVVESYAIGEDRWHTRSSWPPKSDPQRWHLDGLATSHGCDGGRLRADIPRTPQSVEYTYDPDDPVLMRGGAGSLAFILADGGPVHSVEQAGICERADVMSFAGPPLQTPVRIAGKISVVLSVASDAPDTAFTAKLVEVKADGSAYNVRDGIATLAYRSNSDRPLVYKPGRMVRVDIDLWPIEWVFEAGSRIRLDISSSNFPAYHAHPNRAGTWSLQTDAVTARQTLYAGAGRSAYLELPVARLEVVPEPEATP
jgi:putative CocE/NonD family hydrolase